MRGLEKKEGEQKEDAHPKLAVGKRKEDHEEKAETFCTSSLYICDRLEESKYHPS